MNSKEEASRLTAVAANQQWFKILSNGNRDKVVDYIKTGQIPFDDVMVLIAFRQDLEEALSQLDKKQKSVDPFLDWQGKLAGGLAKKGAAERLNQFEEIRKKNPNATPKELVDICRWEGLDIKISTVYSFLKKISK